MNLNLALIYHHNQPTNVRTAGAQAFIIDYTQGEQAITHHWWVLTTANVAGTNGLTLLPKHGGARDNKFWSPIQRLTNAA
jgi:hypothetical protein